ncbi:Lipid A export ATP-binding/permease protein MsbA [Fulvivirga imtechensis AK7]|uniref:Lipid A export ATP-binding/permease protein MsbA n=1 Tax=Fulvivirga imtechensis AK7 TaxID=1237149 RepID=L8JUC3_9BACT|nr:peptidase domain-containing ABC transporter [Fulvivirga imtechensis]ELR72375.1 Lipid A export ATP-binding/permease protein MsbA [Fulvivirga imtechensis AK7]
MSRSIKVKQHDVTDCGAACLASVASFYGLKLPISRIRQYASTDQKGTNVLGMIEAAEKLGFVAKGVRGEFSSLLKIPKPAIAHIIVNKVLHHFVVIFEANEKHVKVMDPGDGRMHTYSNDEFMQLWTGVLLLLLPDDGFEKGNEKVSVGRRLWYLLRPHKTIMLQALFGAAIFTILGLSTSLYVQKIVDHVLVEGNKNLLNLLSIIIIMLVLLIVQIFIGATKSIFTLKTGQLIDARLILGYYKHLLRLPQRFFDNMRVGEIISRVNDAVKIRAFINDTLIELIVNIFIVLFAFGLMFIYYWKLALIMLMIIPFYGLVYFFTNRLNKKTQRKLMESAADLESQLVESLNSVYTIKSFGLEEHANIKTETRFIKLLNNVYVSGKNSIFSGNASQFISRLFTIILLWAGSVFVIDNAITPGELLSFYALVGYLTGPVSSLIGMNKTIQDALIASDRLFELMDLEKEDGENKIKISPEQLGDIHFKDIHFRYGSRTNVFEGLNMKLAFGKVNAIVGESGSGKTTFMSIIQCIYPIEQGAITIGELNLKYTDKESLRDIIGVVPQKIDLFAGNVIDNIAVGDYEPDMQRIIKICSQLNILEFIESLPAGFNTYLGENGASLSGGQKQRIAIARALYREPEILILDEATSSLDSASEQYVQNAVDLLARQGKTVILIAHRLSTVRSADHIVVLQKGKLVEQGTHEALLEVRGHYFNLWKQQLPMLEERSVA